MSARLARRWPGQILRTCPGLVRVAEFSELPLKYRRPINVYPWRRIDPVPWVAMRRPLSEARVALVTSAGLYRPGTDRDFGARAGEDISVRFLPASVSLADLAVGQTSDSFDRQAIERDRNMALPLDRLRELVADGVIGAVAPQHVSFNGALPAPGRFMRDTAPRVAEALLKDAVDAVLFVPV